MYEEIMTKWICGTRSIHRIIHAHINITYMLHTYTHAHTLSNNTNTGYDNPTDPNFYVETTAVKLDITNDNVSHISTHNWRYTGYKPSLRTGDSLARGIVLHFPDWSGRVWSPDHHQYPVPVLPGWNGLSKWSTLYLVSFPGHTSSVPGHSLERWFYTLRFML